MPSTELHTYCVFVDIYILSNKTFNKMFILYQSWFVLIHFRNITYVDATLSKLNGVQFSMSTMIRLHYNLWGNF